MKKKSYMTEQDKHDMFEMFEAGMKGKEIMELTGRAEGTIYAYKKVWRAKKAAEAAESQKAPAEIPEMTGLENSDYAKLYLSGDPVHVRSNFEIKRIVSIRSNKTGIVYEMDPSDDKKLVHITIGDTNFDMVLGAFEKFVDEVVDVFLELTRKS